MFSRHLLRAIMGMGAHMCVSPRGTVHTVTHSELHLCHTTRTHVQLSWLDIICGIPWTSTTHIHMVTHTHTLHADACSGRTRSPDDRVVSSTPLHQHSSHTHQTFCNWLQCCTGIRENQWSTEAGAVLGCNVLPFVNRCTSSTPADMSACKAFAFFIIASALAAMLQACGIYASLTHLELRPRCCC